MAYLDLSSAFLVMAALALIVQYFSTTRRMRSRFPLPPGPKKLPVVGNVFNKPQAPEYKTYAELGRELSQCAA